MTTLIMIDNQENETQLALEAESLAICIEKYREAIAAWKTHQRDNTDMDFSHPDVYYTVGDVLWHL